MICGQHYWLHLNTDLGSRFGSSPLSRQRNEQRKILEQQKERDMHVKSGHMYNFHSRRPCSMVLHQNAEYKLKNRKCKTL